MRSIQQSLYQAADPSTLLLPDLSDELVQNLGVPREPLEQFFGSLVQSSLTCAEHLTNLTKDQFDTFNAGVLQTIHVASLCICLGSVGTPHHFREEAEDELPGSQEPPIQRPQEQCQDRRARTDDDEDDRRPTVRMKSEKSSKGGVRRELAGVLVERRSHMLPGEYCVPPPFDKFHSSVICSNFMELRTLIVQEMHEMCGDLYPTLNERSVILGAIEQFCGPPPTSGGHWDNWRDPVSRKKHKGTAISDLEKARMTPEAYSVSNRSVPGRMRPARPLRNLNNLPPSAAMVKHRTPLTNLSNNDRSTAIVPVSSSTDLDLTALDKELLPDEELEKQVKEMSAKLRELEEQRAAKNAEAKEARAAAAKAAKKAKADAAREAGKAQAEKAQAEKAQAEAQAKATKRKRGNDDESEAEELSDYEKQRLQTMKTNSLWLELLDKCSKASSPMKVLQKDEALALVMNSDGNPEKYVSR